jgi:SPP1 family predicted phage head-tail adaptor
VIINAGQLRWQVALKRPKRAGADSFGEWTGTAEPYAIVWAKVMQERPGIELREGGKVVAKSPFTLLIRWRDDVLADDIVEYKGKDLQITSVRDYDGTQEGLFLECNEYARSHV